MAGIEMTAVELRVALTGGEKWAALRRSDLTIPWSQIQHVEVVAEPYRLVQGLRALGLAVPWRTRIGTWRARGRRIFAVTRRHEPGIRLDLQGHDFSQVLLSLPAPDDVAERLQDRLDALPSTRPAVRQGPGTPDERVIRFASGDTMLGGTLVTPGLGEPVRGAAVVLTGSGALDRDGSQQRAPLDVSRQLAASLAATGVATLRYDKRGIGTSGGDYLATGFHDNVDDARAALQTLASRADTANVPRFVIGHSEGAMIAAVLAAESDNHLAGAVLLAMPAKTGEQTLLWQAAQIAPTLPGPVKAVLKLFRTGPVKQQRALLDRLADTTSDVTRIRGVKMNAKWFRELLAFDPIPVLRAITVPVLAITGDKDLQVDPADLDEIAANVRGPVTVRRVPDLTHILRRDPAEPSIGAYRKLLREPVDGAVLQDISAWIRSASDVASGSAQRATG
jgi:alpha-beta hydrolase superfamily lysophospholipase